MAKRTIQPSDEEIARRAMDLARQVTGRAFVSQNGPFLVTGSSEFHRLRNSLASLSEPPHRSMPLLEANDPEVAHVLRVAHAITKTAMEESDILSAEDDCAPSHDTTILPDPTPGPPAREVSISAFGMNTGTVRRLAAAFPIGAKHVALSRTQTSTNPIHRLAQKLGPLHEMSSYLFHADTPACLTGRLKSLRKSKNRVLPHPWPVGSEDSFLRSIPARRHCWWGGLVVSDSIRVTALDLVRACLPTKGSQLLHLRTKRAGGARIAMATVALLLCVMPDTLNANPGRTLYVKTIDELYQTASRATRGDTISVGGDTIYNFTVRRGQLRLNPGVALVETPGDSVVFRTHGTVEPTERRVIVLNGDNLVRGFDVQAGRYTAAFSSENKKGNVIETCIFTTAADGMGEFACGIHWVDSHGIIRNNLGRVTAGAPLNLVAKIEFTGNASVPAEGYAVTFERNSFVTNATHRGILIRGGIDTRNRVLLRNHTGYNDLPSSWGVVTIQDGVLVVVENAALYRNGYISCTSYPGFVDSVTVSHSFLNRMENRSVITQLDEQSIIWSDVLDSLGRLANPAFVNEESSRRTAIFAIDSISVLIDAGVGVDPDGTPADIGAFYYDQTPLPLPIGTKTLRNVGPNPSSGRVHFYFELDDPITGWLCTYDIYGRLIIAIPVNAAAGEQVVTWDGRNTDGKGVANGVYFYRLYTEERVATPESRRIVILKQSNIGAVLSPAEEHGWHGAASIMRLCGMVAPLGPPCQHPVRHLPPRV